MSLKPDDLPSDLTGAYMVLLAEREALQAERDVAVADAANARAELSDNEALIAHLSCGSRSSNANCTGSGPSARRG